jgi:hypothetical protein
MVENVQFEEDTTQGGQILYSRFERGNKPPAIVLWLIKIGLAKTHAQANYILLGVAVVAFGLSIYLNAPNFTSSPSPSAPSGFEDEI